VALRKPRIILLFLAAALLLGTIATFVAVRVFGAAEHERGTSSQKSSNGLEIVLRTSGRKLTPDEMALALSMMRRRAGMLGVAETEIRMKGSDEIAIGLPRIRDAARRLQVIKKTGQMQIFDLETSLTGPSVKSFVPRPLALYPLLKAIANEAKAQIESSYYLFDENHKLVAGPAETREGLLQMLRSTGRSMRPGDTILGVPGSTTVVSCDLATSRLCPNAHGGFQPKKNQTWYYLFRLPSQFTGKDLNASGIRADFESGGPIVDLSFTKHGDEVFHQITGNEWTRGAALQADQHFAVVLDGELITWPMIEYRDKSLEGGIDPSINGAIIEGIGSVSEARDIATVLQTGALPARFYVVESRRVPTQTR
jgi:preprotein translocase subunit SecD